MKYIRKHRINEALKMPVKKSGSAETSYDSLLDPVRIDMIKETASNYILNNYVWNLADTMEYLISPVIDTIERRVAMDVKMKGRYADVTVYVVGQPSDYCDWAEAWGEVLIFGYNLISGKNMLDGVRKVLADEYNIIADVKFGFRFINPIGLSKINVLNDINGVNVDNILDITEDCQFLHFHGPNPQGISYPDMVYTINLTDISVKEFADGIKSFRNLATDISLEIIMPKNIENAIPAGSVSASDFGGIHIKSFGFNGIYPRINDLTWLGSAFPDTYVELQFRKLPVSSVTYEQWYITISNGGIPIEKLKEFSGQTGVIVWQPSTNACSVYNNRRDIR